MWLIQIDKDQYINALMVDAVSRGKLAQWRARITVSVSQNWFDVHPDYEDSFFNHLQAYNKNSGANIVEALTDR